MPFDIPRYADQVIDYPYTLESQALTSLTIDGRYRNKSGPKSKSGMLHEIRLQTRDREIKTNLTYLAFRPSQSKTMTQLKQICSVA